MNIEQLFNIYEAGQISIELNRLEEQLDVAIANNNFFTFYEIYKQGIQLSEKHDKLIENVLNNVKEENYWNKEFFETIVEPIYNKKLLTKEETKLFFEKYYY